LEAAANDHQNKSRGQTSKVEQHPIKCKGETPCVVGRGPTTFFFCSIFLTDKHFFAEKAPGPWRKPPVCLGGGKKNGSEKGGSRCILN